METRADANLEVHLLLPPKLRSKALGTAQAISFFLEMRATESIKGKRLALGNEIRPLGFQPLFTHLKKCPKKVARITTVTAATKYIYQRTTG